MPFPTVQTAPLSETDPLTADADLGGGNKVNYIQWLRQASVADIQAETIPGRSQHRCCTRFFASRSFSIMQT